MIILQSQASVARTMPTGTAQAVGLRDRVVIARRRIDATTHATAASHLNRRHHEARPSAEQP